jgi:hypothetical protein
MIPAFELAKTIHALDRAATVIGKQNILLSLKKGTFRKLQDDAKPSRDRYFISVLKDKFYGKEIISCYHVQPRPYYGLGNIDTVPWA